MNFKSAFLEGQKGGNVGYPFGEGLEKLTAKIGGAHKARMFFIAAGQKVGKTTFVDYAFIAECYYNEFYLKEEPTRNIEWIYYSLEVDRVSKEFDFVCYFLARHYKIHKIQLPKGITHNGENYIELSSDYLKGYKTDDNGNTIKVSDDILKMVITAYKTFIRPLFGTYDEQGNKIEKGRIFFREYRPTPKRFINDVIAYARKRGKVTSTFNKERGHFDLVSYEPSKENEDLQTVLVFDHVRKVTVETGVLKTALDALSDICINIRNVLKFTIVPIAHTNRGVADVNRLRAAGDRIHPTSDDIKDSGNFPEDSDYVITLFNPNDSKYNLTKHFNLTLKDKAGNTLFPYLRTIHLVDSRHTYFPQHFNSVLLGGTKTFKKFNPNDKIK